MYIHTHTHHLFRYIHVDSDVFINEFKIPKLNLALTWTKPDRDAFINEFRIRLQSRQLLRFVDVGAGILLNFFTSEDLWYGMEEPSSPYGARTAVKTVLTPNSRAQLQSWLMRGPCISQNKSFPEKNLLQCSPLHGNSLPTCSGRIVGYKFWKVLFWWFHNSKCIRILNCDLLRQNYPPIPLTSGCESEIFLILESENGRRC